MKKIVVLNGSPHQSGNTMALVNEVLKPLEGKVTEIKTFNLYTMKINGCLGCYTCKKSGKCVIKDDMQQIYQDINDADGVIFATPVYLQQMSAKLKLAADRLFAYVKQDYTSFLPSNKKALFVATYGGGDKSIYHNYFDLSGKSLQFQGFGEYRILIAGGLSEPKEIMQRSELLSEAKEMDEWLLN